MTSRSNTIRIFVSVTSGAILAATSALAQNAPKGSETLTQIASAAPVLSRGLGSPVVLSRSDVESPLIRIRSIDSEVVIASTATSTADPAFKAVVLTPRGSTGRPVQPLYEPPAVEEQTETPAATGPAPTKQASLPPPSSPSSASPRSIPPAAKPKPVVHVAPAAAAPRVAQAPRAAPAPKFGAAEVAATRAFTRF